MLEREYPGQNCSLARALEIVGERWTLLIIRDAFLGLRRFDQFQQSLGIARNVLTDRLNWLVGEGILERVRYGERPVRHEYQLTAKGRADPAESVQKHLEIARRRAAKGQYFHHPYLGTREFPCDFALLEGEPPSPHKDLLGPPRDLGWMALDLDYAAGNEPRFFRARMVDGVIEVPALGDAGVTA